MLRARFFLSTLVVAGLVPTSASALTTTFTYTGAEQSFVVPSGVTALVVTATGASGGGPSAGLPGGRGAVVTGQIAVTAGQVVRVDVGGAGGQPSGGFNGGGAGASFNGISVFGGGGASDVRSSSGTRLLIAAGGGGSAAPAAAGGDAGSAGGSSPGSDVGGGAGTQSAGGAGGGCALFTIGCGSPGSANLGGAGGTDQSRFGGGGGGGRFGGGGGAGSLSGGVGGGGGGSSLVPAGGTLNLAPAGTPASVVISTRVNAKKYVSYEIPVYSCFAGPVTPAGTNVANVSYIDKGDGDVHLTDIQPIAIPDIANWQIQETIDGGLIGTYFESSSGTRTAIELNGTAVPAIQNTPPVVDVIELQSPPFNLPPGIKIASSTCPPATG